ncbi:MAG: DUF2793 domain-containing protein [Xanthobacteraceae bacterium]
MTDSIHLGLPFIEAAQAQKHVTHNEALIALDAVVMLAAIDRDLSAPPASPVEGARYLVKPPGSGAFAGKDNQIAHYLDGGWSFYAPAKGWTCYVEDEGRLLAWDGAAWEGAGGPITALQNLTLLGAGTAADAANPFAAKLNNALWTAKSVAEGGDGNLRYKLSKESAAKTLSMLFQDNYSGRAEIGLTGDDDFHFKTSPDGSSWVDALLLDRATGATKVGSGFFLAGNISPPQITADQNDYDPTGLSTASVLRLASNAARKITGLAGGLDGRLIVLENVGANAITIAKDDGATSTAANRFAFSFDVVLAPNQAALIQYDGTAARWRLLAAPADGALRYDIDQSAALTSGQKAQIRKSADLPYSGTTAGRLARFTGSAGEQGQTGFSEDGAGNVTGVKSLLLSIDAAADLRTYTNDDHGVYNYYYATNYPSAGQYYRVLDIVATGGNTKSIIRFLNQITSGVAPVETMVVDGSGAINVKNNLAVVGSLSKGAGSFLIDHPLDPLDKDLKHGFVEAPRYDLLYRGRITLAGGQATVDIDAASRMTAGTFAALTQNADVTSLCNRSGFARVRATEIAGGTFTILCEDANSADEIAWVVLAERHDPFIINDDGSWTDQDGRLVPERDKPDYQEA